MNLANDRRSLKQSDKESVLKRWCESEAEAHAISLSTGSGGGGWSDPLVLKFNIFTL